jgi:hypothetical protein
MIYLTQIIQNVDKEGISQEFYYREYFPLAERKFIKSVMHTAFEYV